MSEHGRPDGVGDETKRALGTLSEGWEYLVRTGL